MEKLQRLDRILANSGMGSRREVKQLIRQGKVSANGRIVKDSSLHVNPFKDIILAGGKRVIYREFIYLMMNKPAGVICATRDNYHRTVLDLLDKEYESYNLFPCGRLDMDTRGLVLLTNDGSTAHRITSPARGVKKEYLAMVDGDLDGSMVSIFEEGIVLDDGIRTRPARLDILDGNSPAKALVTITEGRFHQIKRMFAHLGLRVIGLKRLKIGPIEMDKSLPEGAARPLTSQEERMLKDGI